MAADPELVSAIKTAGRARRRWPRCSVAVPSVRPSVTVWPARRPSPAWPVSPRRRAQLFPILFLTVGLVEAMYFINLAFMIVFVFVVGK